MGRVNGPCPRPASPIGIPTGSRFPRTGTDARRCRDHRPSGLDREAGSLRGGTACPRPTAHRRLSARTGRRTMLARPTHGPSGDEDPMRSPHRALVLVLVVIGVLVFAMAPTGGREAVGTGAQGADDDALDRDGGGEAFDPDADLEGRGKRGTSVDTEVREARPDGVVLAPAVPAAGGFADQVRLGFTSGDQWEPAIAADRFGHVYVLYAQYGGVPGCDACLSPTQILTVSADGGTTWSAPRPISAVPDQGWDSQIAVDPVDGRTVWAAWLQKKKSDILVGRSDDFGATWDINVVDDTN